LSIMPGTNCYLDWHRIRAWPSGHGELIGSAYSSPFGVERSRIVRVHVPAAQGARVRGDDPGSGHPLVRSPAAISVFNSQPTCMIVKPHSMAALNVTLQFIRL